MVSRGELELLGTIPCGLGDDLQMAHAEGITLLPRHHGQGTSALVVYDSCSSHHQGGDGETITADIFSLPEYPARDSTAEADI